MVSRSSREFSREVERLEGRDWLPPVILLGDERYRLKAVKPVYWEENV